MSNNLTIIFDKDTEFNKTSGVLSIKTNNQTSIGKTGFDIPSNSQIAMLNLLAPHQYNLVKYNDDLKNFSKLVNDTKEITDIGSFPSGQEFKGSLDLFPV